MGAARNAIVMTENSRLSPIAPHVVEDAAEHAARFSRGDPFRYVVIDDFFEAGYAARLLREFPPFERGNSRNENGDVGNKSTLERIRGIGPAYVALDDMIRSDGFLDLVARLTSIPDLLYDPWYFGGGTHENREGQDLDPHVDFNRHPVENWHRRLNLIVYLNPEWHDAWGGSLELHSDPRAADDRITLVTPVFNRCVIFETTETSWHGFGRIALPASRRDRSRKSVALYFYTRERPPEELADTHSTIYVDRPLPDNIRAGVTLRAEDVAALRDLITRRDQHNQRLYREITRLNVQMQALNGGAFGRLRYLARRIRAQFQR